MGTRALLNATGEGMYKLHHRTFVRMYISYERNGMNRYYHVPQVHTHTHTYGVHRKHLMPTTRTRHTAGRTAPPDWVGCKCDQTLDIKDRARCLPSQTHECWRGGAAGHWKRCGPNCAACLCLPALSTATQRRPAGRNRFDSSPASYSVGSPAANLRFPNKSGRLK